jgi:hypothetical protein
MPVKQKKTDGRGFLFYNLSVPIRFPVQSVPCFLPSSFKENEKLSVSDASAFEFELL